MPPKENIRGNSFCARIIALLKEHRSRSGQGSPRKEISGIAMLHQRIKLFCFQDEIQSGLFSLRG